jgi:uncharacterized protein with von Willebrand factor type A (vWA) domain
MTAPQPGSGDGGILAKFAAKTGKTFGAFKPKTRKEFTRQIIKTTSWDEFDWKTIRRDKEISAAIQDLYLGDIKNPEERPGYLNAPELIQDIFMTFLKPVPMLYKKTEVKRDARLNGKFVEQLMALTDWERLHDQTATDVMLAKMATTVVIEALQEMIKQHREAVQRANEERQKGSDRIPDKDLPPSNGGDSWDEESGQGQSQGGGAGGEGNAQAGPQTKNEGKSQQGDTDPGEPGEENEPQETPWDSEQEAREQMRQELEEERKRQEEQGASQGEFSGKNADQSTGEHGESEGEGEGDEADLDAQIDDQEREVDEVDLDEVEESDWESMLNDVDFGRHVNAALQKAADDISELDELRKGVGIDDAEWKMMDPTERLKIAERLNTPRMKKIADMVGRMKRFAMSKQATKVIDAPHEIYDVEMGDDLRRVLRSEFAFLGHPEAKIEFYRKYINKELLQYKERGHEDVGKGPMIVCIDNSGSMGGAPENWAKGVAEAMRRVCAEQRRDYYAMYFEVNRHRECFDFPMGQGPFEKVLAFLSVSAGGGTEFDGVLTEALQRCETMFENEGKGKADIVFITDGEAYLDQAWIDQFVEKRDKIGCRIFGIYISAYDSTRSSATRLLESFCQIVVPVKALEVNDDASDLLFSVL